MIRSVSGSTSDVVDQLGLDVLDDGAIGSQDPANDLRLQERSAVGQRVVRVQDLERRGRVVALADARLVDLAGIDRLVEQVLLPLVRGNDAARLGRQVDACPCAVAELLGPLPKAVDAERSCQLVEVRVARVREAAVDIERAEAAAVPVVVLVRADLEVAGGLQQRRVVDESVLERAGGGDQLVCRAGRVLLGDPEVHQRPIRVLDQRLVFVVADAAREHVVVVRGQRDHRQDLAGLRVHDDDHAALQVDDVRGPLQGLLGLALDLDVDRQLERVARLRLLRHLDGPQDAAESVLLHFLLAVRAAEHVLERRLDAGLADLIVIEVARVTERGQFVGRHRARVAENVRDERAVLVFAPLLDTHLYAGEAVALLHDDPRNVARDV